VSFALGVGPQRQCKKDDPEPMPLTTGTHLGPYEIVAPIGVGGMGEVYKARDTRLNRTVAIKVLPEHISGNAEAKQRFEREAQTVASLNHPNICVLHDVGHENGVDFLVMEHLEGVTLEERLTKGAIPLAEASKIGMEVVDALEKAHRSGVVHRDLKPGNIMLTKSGAKLLDFGLAKSVSGGASTGGNVHPQSDLTAAPTVNTALTTQGTIMGTIPYMAPEQIEGQETDARTDIFAFGAVFYEMVTGRRAFQGKTQPSLMSSILTVNPPLPSQVLSSVPPGFDHVIERCLAKDPDDRWQSARDLWLELKSARDPSRAAPAVATVKNSNRLTWLLGGAVAALLAATSILAFLYFRAPAPDAPSIRFEVPAVGSPFNMSISPDGLGLAYVAPTEDGKNVLWVRALSSLEARILPGTEGADVPDWSPDSRFIVFGADQKLKKVAVSGGPPQTLTSLLPGNRSRAAWNRDGVILYANARVIRRVSDAGGESSPVTEIDNSLGELFHATPWFLPDGRHFLFQVWSEATENRAVYVASLDSNGRTRLMSAESKALYVPPGFILFVRERTLMARPFDANRRAFNGDAVPIAEEVAYSLNNGAAAFYASDEGTLIYRRGTSVTPGTRQWMWIDRTGKVSSPIGERHNVQSLNLSPDGRKIVFHDNVSGQPPDVWIFDLERNLRSRLTTDPAADGFPVWSPDGERVVFGSQRDGNAPQAEARPPAPTGRGRGSAGVTLFTKPANGAVPELMLLPPEPNKMMVPYDWSPDGRMIVAQRFEDVATAQSDLWIVPLTGDRKPRPYLASAFSEGEPALSPDGRWLAYVSNESGAFQVVVQPFPDPSGGKWQVSTRGGHYPRWRRDGRELYYLDPDRQIVAVSWTTGRGFEVGRSTPLFAAPFTFPDSAINALENPYDVTADGQRFLVSAPLTVSTTTQTPITVITNWTSVLKR
jgi:eukaryotic-like serine/threonine-protein kinase